MADDNEKKPAEQQPKGADADEGEQANLDIGESTEAEHEVTHTDELTADVNVNKVSGSQQRLWVMVMIGVVVLAIGGFTLFRQLEGEIPDNTQFVTTTVEEEDPSRGYVVYALKPGDSNLRDYYVSEQTSEDRGLAQTVAGGRSSGDFQLSSSGQVYAVKTGANSIFTKNGEAEHTHALDGLSDWLLIPDGTRLYALANGNLHSFDTTTGEAGQVAENFALSGDTTGLLFARDGTIRQYSKSGLSLTEAHYNTKSGEATSRTASVIRLDQLGSVANASMAPDGTSLIFIATINGNSTLQLLSLNSFVLRTVFISDLPGGVPTSFSWSDDSNNIAINVTGNGTARLTNLKVGTLEKVIVLEQPGSGSRFANLNWSPDKKQISYVQDGALKIVSIESGDIIDAISGISNDAYTGWFLD